MTLCQFMTSGGPGRGPKTSECMRREMNLGLLSPSHPSQRLEEMCFPGQPRARAYGKRPGASPCFGRCGTVVQQLVLSDFSFSCLPRLPLLPDDCRQRFAGSHHFLLHLRCTRQSSFSKSLHSILRVSRVVLSFKPLASTDIPGASMQHYPRSSFLSDVLEASA